MDDGPTTSSTHDEFKCTNKTPSKQPIEKATSKMICYSWIKIMKDSRETAADAPPQTDKKYTRERLAV